MCQPLRRSISAFILVAALEMFSSSARGETPKPPAADTDTPASAPRSASNTATTPDQRVSIRGLDGEAIHTHGGPPAQLGSARFAIVARQAAAQISVESIEFLTGHSCAIPPATVSARPKAVRLLVDGSAQPTSRPALTVQPNTTTQATVYFTPTVSAYMTWCDRFAFRVRFRVDRDALTAIAETWVTREEPYRERN